MSFLSTTSAKLRDGSRDVFCHYYSTPRSHEAITFSALRELVVPKINLLKTQVSPESLLFIIDDDVLGQISWWLSALLVNTTPGILTPITPKLDQDKYFAELDSVLASYGNAKVLINKTLIANSKYLKIKEADKLLIYGEEDFGEAAADELQWIEPRFGHKPLVFQQSSGTTGIRKGMLLTEQMVLNQLENYNQTLKLDPANDV